MSTQETKQSSTEKPRNAVRPSQRKADKPKGKGSQGERTKGPQVPHYLKLSPKYLGWKRLAKSLAAKLAEVDMSISELGKAIAEYSSRGCTFSFDKDLVSDYQNYESARLEWEKFRDSFRNEMDSTGLPTGIAAKLLGGGTLTAPPSIDGTAP